MPKAKKNSTVNIIVGVMLISIAYAIIRYHLVGNVLWKDFPFYILNKGLSLSAFILISLTFSLASAKKLGLPISDSWLNARKALGVSGFLLVLMHLFMSLLLFSPAHYAKMFEADASMTFNTGISMLFGILAFVVLWGYNLSFQTFLREDKAFIAFITSRPFLLVVFTFGAIHLLFMGFNGWLNPSLWNGGLPPISLVAFSIFVVGYGMNLLARE